MLRTDLPQACLPPLFKGKTVVVWGDRCQVDPVREGYNLVEVSLSAFLGVFGRLQPAKEVLGPCAFGVRVLHLW
jgi:hypothetical protein